MANLLEIKSDEHLLLEVQALLSERFARSAAILCEAKDLLTEGKNKLFTDIEHLLEKSAPHIERINEQRHATAPKFNVFSALGVSRRELSHSSFLAYLLSPKGDHEQGAKFLNAFVQLIGMKDISGHNPRKVHVDTELAAGDELGRMDIVVSCRPNWLIVIENKIDAGEGEEQLPRYLKWMDGQNGYVTKELVFLTPMGHHSVTARTDSYHRISYAQLAEVFGGFNNENMNETMPPSVREVVKQYVYTCKLIGGVAVTVMDKKLKDLLSTNENLPAALEIEQQMALFRRQVAENFVKNIAADLNRRLKDDAMWCADFESSSDGKFNVRILTKRHRIQRNYFVKAECVFSASSNTGWLGWQRNIWIDAKLYSGAETVGLTKEMLENGCTGGGDGNWVAGRIPRGGSYGYDLTNNQHIIECHEDNQDPGHACATEIADEMWDMFTRYRAQIVEFPGFKSSWE